MVFFNALKYSLTIACEKELEKNFLITFGQLFGISNHCASLSEELLLMCREVDQRKAVSSVNCAEDIENIKEAGLTNVLKNPKVFLQTLRVK